MRTLDAAAVREATPWPEFIGAIEAILAENHAAAPERHVHPVGLPDEFTLFKSAGFAAADLAAARLALR